MGKKERIVLVIESEISKEIKKRAKKDGVTVTGYIKDLLVANIAGKFEAKHNDIYKRMINNPYFIMAVKKSIKDSLGGSNSKSSANGSKVDNSCSNDNYGLNAVDYDNICNNSKFQSMSEEEKVAKVEGFKDYKNNS